WFIIDLVAAIPFDLLPLAPIRTKPRRLSACLKRLAFYDSSAWLERSTATL
ncbi:Hypothetical protein FKW44_016619, partial [Caligus rogercresseyi]